jgi:hypothetical protein
MTGAPHRLQRAAAAAAAAVAVAVLLASCGGARNTLGTSASACYRALPGAKQAVSNKGSIVGVRKFPVSSLQKRVPSDPQLAKLPPKESLCVFAFRGKYQATDVPQAPVRKEGSYAVVALTLKSPRVVAAYILDQLPGRFRHTRA